MSKTYKVRDKLYIRDGSFAAMGARKTGRKEIHRKRGPRGGWLVMFSPFTAARHRKSRDK